MSNEDPTSLSSRDPEIRRLQKLIGRALPFLARSGEGPPAYTPQKREISPGEARGFFRAIDEGLFKLEKDSQCRPVGMRASYCYPLLFRPLRAENSVQLWREWLTHAAAVACVHLDYGYPRHDIALDVDAFDILVYSPSNQPLVAVEAKKTSRELNAMLEEMSRLQGKPWELNCNAPRLSNAAKKFRGLLALRPPFFLAVAPGISLAHAVSYPDERSIQTAELTAIERIASARL